MCLNSTKSQLFTGTADLRGCLEDSLFSRSETGCVCTRQQEIYIQGNQVCLIPYAITKAGFLANATFEVADKRRDLGT